jgi:hypothetical protein
MEDIRRISEIYNQLALASSRIYFTLEQMSQIHFLYQFSLNYFLEVFYSVLQNNKNLVGLIDSTQRLEVLTKDLFFSIFHRVSRFFPVFVFIVALIDQQCTLHSLWIFDNILQEFASGGSTFICNSLGSNSLERN